MSALLVLTGGGITIIEREEEVPRFVGVAATPTPQQTTVEPKDPAATPKPAVTPSRAVADTTARLTANGPAIRSAPDEKYRAVDAVVDPDGERHVRFQRTHRGLPVIGGDFVVHSTAGGGFTGVTVAQRQPIDVPATAAVSRARAVTAAGLDRTATARRVVDARERVPALAWEVTDGREVVLVDATTGKVRLTYDTAEHAAAGTGHGLQVGDVELDTTRADDGSYTLVDPKRGGNTVRDALNQTYPARIGTSAEFTDADGEWGDGTPADRSTAAVDVLYGMARTWDYLLETFGRSGLKNDGQGAVAYVHHSVNESNASWRGGSCRCMLFGDGSGMFGPFTTIDVVAHEMAHGLDEATANLLNAGESGGLGEASSDIFGTLVEFAANNPADPPDYLIGEKLNPAGPPLRRMDEPNLIGKSVSCWSPTIKDLDEHNSAGVGNKFFYNLAVGSGSSRWGDSTPCAGAGPVTGIGNDRAARIWYRALTVYMVSNTDYAGAREATLLAATDLYGPDSTERATVDAAWKAAGVDGSRPGYGAPQIDRFADPSPALRIGTPVRVQVTAKDPQGQPVTFSATKLPPGVSIDAAGLISGAPTVRGEYQSLIKVTDPDGNSSDEVMWWIVKGPPVVQSVYPPMSWQLGSRPVVGRFSATFADVPDYMDDSDKAVRVTVTGLPQGFSMSVSRPNYGGVYHADVVGIVEAAGRGTAVFTATDADGEQVTASVPWEVLPATLPGHPDPVAVTGGNGTAQVTWDRPSGGSTAPTGYLVRVSGGAVTRLDDKARSLTLTGLDIRKSYTVGVRATSTIGDGAERTVTLAPTGLPVTASPAAISHGKTSVLSGRVLRGNTSPVAGATATLESRPAGKTTWGRVATVKTDAKGTWRSTVKPATTTAYRVRFTGSTGMWPATSGTASTSVRSTVSVKASTTRPKANKKIKISGTAKPARAGVKITLQRKSGSRWVTITSTKTTKTGTYAFSRAFKRGTWPLRVVVAGSAYNTTANSTTVTIKVK
ncbi:M4 family metallopeptidase [Actinoplanes sp. G11-F43]|uniref:M4 family metallopeptidase n=1 Tax=Actinoplanes sp. G11-F43 TaxID=3424130 RepID=UPI003D34E51E